MTITLTTCTSHDDIKRDTIANVCVCVRSRARFFLVDDVYKSDDDVKRDMILSVDVFSLA